MAIGVRRGMLVSLLLTLGCGGGGGRGEHPAPTGTPGGFVAGYHVWWAGDAWADYPLRDLDRLYLFEIELTSDGHLGDTHGWPEGWSSLLAAAGEAGVSVVPAVTLHPEQAVVDLLSDPEAVRRAARSIASLVKGDPGLDGVHLDLEVFRPVPQEVRYGYVDLARAVRREFDGDRPRPVLSIFLPALDVDDAYDEAALAEVADYVVVQGYDLHHRTGGRAGPVAAVRGWPPLDWDTVVERLLGLGLSPRSLVMGIPLYGYRWPTDGPEPGSPTRGPGEIMPLSAPPDVVPGLPRVQDEAGSVALLRDPRSGSPYYAVETGEGWVQGWFEDPESLRAKREFVARHGLGGVAYFPLVYATPAVRGELRRP